MTRPNRITLTTLSVTDMARARAFYEALGWVPEDAREDVAFYAMNGAKFGLYRRERLAEDLGLAVQDLGTGAMTLAQNFATAAEVDAAYARALKAGAQALKPPQKAFWGGYSGTFRDPDGHVWEYAMNPYWGLDPNSNLS